MSIDNDIMTDASSVKAFLFPHLKSYDKGKSHVRNVPDVTA